MYYSIRRKQLGTAFSILAVLFLLIGFSAKTGVCRSSGQTVDQRYPGLVSGILKNARLESMDEKFLLKSDMVTIRRGELTGMLSGLDDRTRSQIKKNLLFVLEQEAVRKILLNEAKKAGIATKDMDKKEIVQTFFDHKTETVTVTEKEARDFYRNNREMVGERPFEKVREAVRGYLLERKKKQFVVTYIRKLVADIDLEVNEKWVAEQRRIVMDNPVDKARNSGLPTMVEFGADGCVPCDMMQPILEQMRKDFPDRLNVEFVHVGKEQMMAARFGVESIPVQVFYDKDGKEVYRHTGFLAKEKVYSQLADMGLEPSAEAGAGGSAEKKEGLRSAKVFTIGSGPVEILLYTDYFCPPCRDIEPYLEITLAKLVSSGAKVTFVDAAFNRKSSLFSRYFLYAAKAASSPESVIHARSVLFRLAEKDEVETEQEMRKALKENEVAIDSFDTQPLMTQWMELLEKHGLRTTPTCVIIKPGEKVEKHSGSIEIPKAMDRLLEEMSPDQ